MRNSRPKALYAVLAVLLVGLYLASEWIRPINEQLIEASKPKGSSQKSGDALVQLPTQFIVATVTGFREAVAGILWVRADEFFHMGQYQAIIPIVRMVTWLDPHQIDVYSTGAWHLDYNFVDESSRSDKRYIWPAIALLEEGIRNNPDIWDLYFELGWTHYRAKLNDNKMAVKYIEEACKRDGIELNTGRRVPRPEYVDRMLAHQYERAGELEKSIKAWKFAYNRTKKLLNDPKYKKLYIDNTSLDVCQKNLGLLLLRMGWRYGNMKAYKEGVEIYKKLAQKEKAMRQKKKGLYDAELVRAAEAAEKDYKQRVATNNPPSDALKPLDMNFDAEWVKVKPRVIRIKGRVNLVPASEYKDLAVECFTQWYARNQQKPPQERAKWQDGARANWMLTDYDYKPPTKKTFEWKVDLDKTVTWDQMPIRSGQFNEEIVLRNEEFYPLKAKKYRLTVWVTPEDGGIFGGCPDYIQDRVGWKGEAFWDKRYLDTKSKPGFKILKKEFIIKREELL